MASYLIALGVVGMGVQSLLGRGMEIGLGEGLGFAVATTAGCVLLHVMFPGYRVHGYTAGGLTGELVGEVSLGMFHHAGTYLVALAVMCAGLLASTPLSSAHLVSLGRLVWRGARGTVMYLVEGARELIRSQREALEREDAEAYADDTHPDDRYEYEEDEPGEAEDDELEDDEAEDDELAEPGPARSRSKRGRSKAKARAETETETAIEVASDELDPSEAEAEEETSGRKTSSKGNRRTSGAGNRRRGEANDAPEVAPPAVTAAAISPADDDLDELPEIVMKQDEPAPEPTPEARDEAADPDEAPETDEAAEPERPGKKAPPRPESLRAANRGPAAPPEEPRPRHGIPGVVKLVSGPYQLPPLHLFEAVASPERNEVDRGFVLEQAQRLVATLAEFRIKG
jgi:hypothetical protein